MQPNYLSVAQYSKLRNFFCSFENMIFRKKKFGANKSVTTSWDVHLPLIDSFTLTLRFKI